MSILSIDWAEYLFDHLSLKLYEKEQDRYRKQKENEKTRIVKNNRIIVKVNNDVIFDSKVEKEMSDELYYALLSYGLLDSVKNKRGNKNTPINYNLYPTIRVLPSLQEDIS